MARLTVTYDMWGPPFADVPLADHYSAMLEQAAYVDEHGFAGVAFNQHHATDDGYLPSPVIASAAAAARTRTLRIQPLLLAPFYSPLKLAEDLAVVDLVSNGRLTPVIAAAYRAEEFAMFDVDRAGRRTAVAELIETLRQAWSGDPFLYRGRTVRVTPRPAQQPCPPVMMAGASRAAARDAARLADGFYPTSPEWHDVYRRECELLGREDVGPPPRYGPMFVHVAEDPDREWPLISEYLVNAVRAYRSFSQPNAAAMGQMPPQFKIESEPDLRESEHYLILTPDECVALLDELAPDESFTFRPSWGGFNPELGARCLQLVVEQVMPRLSRP